MLSASYIGSQARSDIFSPSLTTSDFAIGEGNKGFYWYTENYDWPDDISAVTTHHLREFIAYLRDTDHRFNSNCPRAMKPINSTTIQKYYQALSALFNWSANEGIFGATQQRKKRARQHIRAPAWVSTDKTTFWIYKRLRVDP